MGGIAKDISGTDHLALVSSRGARCVDVHRCIPRFDCYSVFIRRTGRARVMHRRGIWLAVGAVGIISFPSTHSVVRADSSHVRASPSPEVELFT